MYCDPTGHFVISTFILVGFIIGAVVGGVVVGAPAHQVAKENGAAGLVIAFSLGANRYKTKDGRSNSTQNKEIDDLQRKYKFGKNSDVNYMMRSLVRVIPKKS